MTEIPSACVNPTVSPASLQTQIATEIEALVASLPNPDHLSAEQRRAIIARYTAVLEGNFIYWMTGAYLCARSEAARLSILDNLREEVRDSHPAMLRRFALAAGAIPRDCDVIAVHQDLTNVRLFVGQLSEVRVLLMMTFFEGFIQRFMDFLARLATDQGSLDHEYTDVHGVCDIAHTRELFHALEAEIALNRPEPGEHLFEGVELLRGLIQTIVIGAQSSGAPGLTDLARGAVTG
jgi:hypothetical protein